MHKNGSGGDSRERIERIEQGLGNEKLKKLQRNQILTNELQDIERVGSWHSVPKMRVLSEDNIAVNIAINRREKVLHSDFLSRADSHRPSHPRARGSSSPASPDRRFSPEVLRNGLGLSPASDARVAEIMSGRNWLEEQRSPGIDMDSTYLSEISSDSPQLVPPIGPGAMPGYRPASSLWAMDTSPQSIIRETARTVYPPKYSASGSSRDGRCGIAPSCSDLGDNAGNLFACAGNQGPACASGACENEVDVSGHGDGRGILKGTPQEPMLAVHMRRMEEDLKNGNSPAWKKSSAGMPPRSPSPPCSSPWDQSDAAGAHPRVHFQGSGSFTGSCADTESSKARSGSNMKGVYAWHYDRKKGGGAEDEDERSGMEKFLNVLGMTSRWWLAQ